MDGVLHFRGRDFAPRRQLSSPAPTGRADREEHGRMCGIHLSLQETVAAVVCLGDRSAAEVIASKLCDKVLRDQSTPDLVRARHARSALSLGGARGRSSRDACGQ